MHDAYKIKLDPLISEEINIHFPQLIFIYVYAIQQQPSFALPQYTNNPFLDERSCVTEMDKEPIESFINGECDLWQTEKFAVYN